VNNRRRWDIGLRLIGALLVATALAGVYLCRVLARVGGSRPATATLIVLAMSAFVCASSGFRLLSLGADILPGANHSKRRRP
jgi:hypothetical protein